MPRNAHYSSLEAANNEIENLRKQGVVDIHTLLNAGLVSYSAALLGEIEPTVAGLRLETINAKRLLGFSMILNGLFGSLLILIAIMYFFWRT